MERSDDLERLDENDWVFYKSYTASSYKKIWEILNKEKKRLNEEKMK
jgi:hypothetical protein